MLNLYKDFETLQEIIDAYKKSLSQKNKVYSKEELDYKILKIKRSLSKLPFLKLSIIQELAKEDDTEIKIAITNNVFITPKILNDLARDESKEVKIRVAMNIITASDTFEELLKYNDIDVNLALAKNINMPSYILRELALCDDLRIKLAVAENPNTPIDVLNIIVGDGSNTDLNIIVTANPDISEDTLRICIKKCKDEKLLINIAKHKNTPSDILTLLYDTKNADVIEGISMNQNTTEEILRKIYRKYKKYRYNLAKNPSTPKDVLKKLSKIKRKNLHIVRKVAANPNTPESILKKFTKKNNPRMIRIESIENPNISTEVLESLENDRDYEVAVKAHKALDDRQNKK